MRIRLESTDTTSGGVSQTRAVEVESHGTGIVRLRDFAMEMLGQLGASDVMITAPSERHRSEDPSEDPTPPPVLEGAGGAP